MAENFQQTAAALFKGMEDFITTKTVVGEPVQVGDTTILPLVDVSFGAMASSKAEPSRHNGGGGIGGKMSPSALLVVKDGNVRLINVKNQDSLTKVLDMAPDVISRFFPGRNKPDPEVEKACEEAAGEEKKF